MTLSVVQFPDSPAAQDIPAALRKLADGIEAGEYGDAHNVAWIIDCGDGRKEIGLLGKSPSPGAEAHLLFALAQHRILDGVKLEQW